MPSEAYCIGDVLVDSGLSLSCVPLLWLASQSIGEGTIGYIVTCALPMACTSNFRITLDVQAMSILPSGVWCRLVGEGEVENMITNYCDQRIALLNIENREFAVQLSLSDRP